MTDVAATAAEVTPIREVDGRLLRQSPGPVTELLQRTDLELVRGVGERAAGQLAPGTNSVSYIW